MTCDEIHLLLESDSRDAKEDAALSEHLSACPTCSAHAAEMCKQDALMKRALTMKSDEVQFERVKSRLARDINQDRVARLRWRMLALAGSVAAMLMVGVSIYWLNAPTIVNTPIAEQPIAASSDVFNQVADL